MIKFSEKERIKLYRSISDELFSDLDEPPVLGKKMSKSVVIPLEKYTDFSIHVTHSQFRPDYAHTKAYIQMSNGPRTKICAACESGDTFVSTLWPSIKECLNRFAELYNELEKGTGTGHNIYTGLGDFIESAEARGALRAYIKGEMKEPYLPRPSRSIENER